MKYTKVRETMSSEIQLNSGILLDTFEPATGSFELTNIIGVTTGTFQFADNITFTDFGSDVNNLSKNSMEMKRIESHEVTATGTYVTLTAEQAKLLIGAADVADTKITPRNNLNDTDFMDIWWVGDYSNKNGETNGGFIAIHMMNVLNTGGFRIQTGDKAKGQFAFTYTAHYSIAAQDVVPYEVYIKAGTDEA